MQGAHPNPELLALGIRQPWAELILRGIKRIEVRSQNTQVRGPIYLYASKRLSDHPAAREAIERYDIDVDSLPLGVVVGTVEVCGSAPTRLEDVEEACVPSGELFRRFSWYLSNPYRLPEPLPVRFLPYGMWFYPWRRR